MPMRLSSGELRRAINELGSVAWAARLLDFLPGRQTEVVDAGRAQRAMPPESTFGDVLDACCNFHRSSPGQPRGYTGVGGHSTSRPGAARAPGHGVHGTAAPEGRS